MGKCACILLIAGIALPVAAQAQQNPPAAPSAFAEALQSAGVVARSCDKSNPAEVVVCGQSRPRYRIDPNVLAGARAVEAPPAKAPLDASTDQSCVGPNCGGGTIPLVGMALTALKAAELAARGDDWREAFRTRADAYKAYQDAKAEDAKHSHVTVGINAGSK